MRIAFLPFNRGLAHFTRSLVVAEELKRRDHEVLCWLPPALNDYAAKMNVATHSDEPLMSADTSGAFEMHKDADFLYHHAKRLREQLSRFRPDVAVIDFHLPGLIAAQSLDIPIIYITHTNGLPDGFRIPNPGIPPTLFSIAQPLLGQIVRRRMRAYIEPMNISLRKLSNRKQNCFDAVTYLIPEPKGYLTPSQQKAVHYCGPLLWPPFEDIALPPEITSFPKEKTIYVTGGGTGFDTSFTVRLCEALLDVDWRVIVATGKRLDISAFPKSPHLAVHEFLPGRKVMSLSQIVICHGAYGTLVQAALEEIPALCIPVNPDQLIHSARWQELGFGKLLWPLSLARLKAALSTDLGGFEDLALRIQPSAVLQAVASLQEFFALQPKTASWPPNLFVPEHAAQRAADIVEESVRGNRGD